MPTCKSCKADLTEKEAVTRKYVDSDDKKNPDVYGLGHYTSEGDFDPDETITLDGHDTFDGCDTCTVCGSVVG